MQTKLNTEAAHFGAKLFYFITTIIILLILGLYKDPLSDSIKQLHFVYFSLFFSLVLICSALFIYSGQNPGFADQINLEENMNENLFRNQQYSTIDEGNTLENHEDSKQEDIECKIFPPPKRYCDICGIYQPYRTKHCFKCDRCILKYDHHCFWIGSCVGQYNQVKFWIFLFSQSVLNIWVFSICWQGMDNYPYQDKNGNYSQEYGAFFVAFSITFGFFILIFSLLIYHTYLILTNQTTWEQSKRNRITYLKLYPSKFRPFDKGLKENLQNAIFNSKKM